ncbi:hypothetical protein AKJ38_03445, partial [candidate division MSBL1 archaeon SCGC-AAA259I14]
GQLLEGLPLFKTVRTHHHLGSEIDSLRSLESRGALDPEDKQRIGRVLERAEELMSHDWTDGSEFSERLGKRLDPLRGLTDRS